MRGIIQSGFFATQNSKCGTASGGRFSATSAWARLKRKSSLSGCRATAAANWSERDGIASHFVHHQEHAGRVVWAAAAHGEHDDFFQRLRRIAWLREVASEFTFAHHAGYPVGHEQIAVARGERARDEVDLGRG